MRRISALIGACAVFLVASGALAVTIGTPPTMTHSVVNNGAGDQTDPHVSGSLVSYTEVDAGLRIHYHDLATGVDAAIPNTVVPLPGATWIWAPGITGATAPAELAQFFFTKTITLAAAPAAATFLIAADDFAEVRVNGAVVGTTGSTTVAVSPGPFTVLKSLDILPHLTAGANTITVRGQNGVGSFAACTNCTYKQHPAGVVFGGSITAGGSVVNVLSGTSWQTYAVDPASAGATSLGSAQNVCLHASSPAGCPSGATLYGYSGGSSWTATDPWSGLDFLSDASGTKVVFTRNSSIYLFDTASGGLPIEVAPSATANRRHAAIGGNTVAWQDFGFNASSLQPEIVVHDLTSGTTTRITNDALFDRAPLAVSPDGNTLVWAKCQTNGTGCDIWMAIKSGGSWSASAFTGSSGEEASPDSDGQVIAYSSTRSGETDIYWQPVPGGSEQQIALTGVQVRPTISSGFIVFESLNASGDFDIWCYDTAANTAYRLTSSAANEILADVSVSASGLVRVVYTSNATGDFNVHALSFQRPSTVDTIEELVTLVQSFNLKQGLENSLDAKLQNVQQALDKQKAGDKQAACNMLDAFKNEVTAQEKPGH